MLFARNGGSGCTDYLRSSCSQTASDAILPHFRALLADWIHTAVVYCILLAFGFTVYTTAEKIGSVGRMYELLVAEGARNPVPGNAGGSFLTMRSVSGLIFGCVFPSGASLHNGRPLTSVNGDEPPFAPQHTALSTSAETSVPSTSINVRVRLAKSFEECRPRHRTDVALPFDPRSHTHSHSQPYLQPTGTAPSPRSQFPASLDSSLEAPPGSESPSHSLRPWGWPLSLFATVTLRSLSLHQATSALDYPPPLLLPLSWEPAELP